MLSREVRLKNGVKIPLLGFGTYKLGNFDETKKAVKNAIISGYRHIDTASFYGNEDGVGEGIKESNIDRNEIFLTTKVWNDDHGYDNTINAFEKSLKKLRVNYIDLYLIHWPTKLNSDTWRALEDLYNQGKVKAIGVCNFKENHIEDLKKTAKIMPMINQIEIHPYRSQKSIINYCNENKIQVVAWGPIMRGKIFDDEKMITLSKKYNKTIPQLTLRWHIQNGVIPIPKSSNKDRMEENLSIFNFKISKDDMKIIDDLNKNQCVSVVPNGTTY